MSAREVIGMQLTHRGDRARKARDDLARVLPGAEVGEPDATGIFEVVVEAADREAALAAVWNAVAAAGVDDHIAFAEHADVPEHWRARDTGG